MKTAVPGEDDQGHISIILAADAGPPPPLPAARLPAVWTKTKGKVGRPFRYIHQDFFSGRQFRNLEYLNAQSIEWLDTTTTPYRIASHNRTE